MLLNHFCLKYLIFCDANSRKLHNSFLQAGTNPAVYGSGDETFGKSFGWSAGHAQRYFFFFVLQSYLKEQIL